VVAARGRRRAGSPEGGALLKGRAGARSGADPALGWEREESMGERKVRKSWLRRGGSALLIAVVGVSVATLADAHGGGRQQGARLRQQDQRRGEDRRSERHLLGE
jgi:hypothetical protein